MPIQEKEYEAPQMNVISKEEFEMHVTDVLKTLWEILSKSYGPYGSNTIIFKYPFSHVTKDGFTIANSLSANVAKTYTNQAITRMAVDICGRMNVAVGDGTTSAIVCTNSLYQNYIKYRSVFEKYNFVPRDILRKFEDVKTLIRKELRTFAEPVNVADDDNGRVAEKIRKVVEISSNGDKSIVDAITDQYLQFRYPSIICEKSLDGKESVDIIHGYRLSLRLTDRLYANRDDGTMHLKDADVLIFTCKITDDIFTGIIQPALILSQGCGRHLLVCAPSYDEVLIKRKIVPMVQQEFSETKDSALVLCTYKAMNEYHRQMITDFAILCHTITIDRSMAEAIISNTERGYRSNTEKPPIIALINARRHWLDKVDVKYPVIDTNGRVMAFAPTTPEIEESYKEIIELIPGEGEAYESSRLSFNLGYCRNLELGMDNSIIHNFFYNENQYQMALSDAELSLQEVEEKYKKLGTFNTETTYAQMRYFALKMELTSIEVGGDSELSIGMRKDVYDDAIRAASSAYKYGIINGCNLDTLRATENLMKNYSLADCVVDGKDQKLTLTMLLLAIIRMGFVDTYRTVLTNWIADKKLFEDRKTANMRDVCQELYDFAEQKCGTSLQELFDIDIEKIGISDYLESLIVKILAARRPLEVIEPVTIFDILIQHSIETGLVFDVIEKRFSKDIVNSLQTDDEILNAVIDLMSLLISGNQMVVTQKNTFEV